MLKSGFKKTNLKKKNLRNSPNVCDFQNENHTSGYGIENP
jgi:hypothetical protein